MTSMRLAETRALIGKELQQHRRILIALSLMLATFWLFGWAIFLRGTRAVSVFEVLPGFFTLGLPAAAVVLSHRMVVAEYYGRTQRFLEALPLHRSHEALVKAALGLGIMSAWALAALAATAALALRHESLERAFVGILTTRLAGFVFACWGLAFLFSMFGRLRLPLLLGAGLVLILLNQRSELSLGNWGPLALVHPSTFPVERHVLPRAALLWSCAIGAVGFALGIALVRLREGSIIESLARPLALREKAALLLVVTGALIVMSVADKRKLTPMPPLQEQEQQVLRRGDLEIVYLDEALRAPAERLAAALAPLQAALADILPAPHLRLRVVHGNDVTPERPQLVSTHARQGLIMRVNLTTFAGPASPAGHAARAVAEVLHGLVFAAAGPRVYTEPKHWLLDGFTLYLATRGLPGTPHPPDDPSAPDLTLAAALVAAHSSGFSLPNRADLAAYFPLAERLGELPAAALAASGWVLLEQQAGAARVWALARAAFARAGTNDIRDFIAERRWPMPRLFFEATGIAWDDFLGRWRGWLQERARVPAMAERLARLPRATIAIAAAAEGVDAVTVRGRFTALPPDAECEALHRLEAWFDTGPQPEVMDDDRISLAADGHSFLRPLEGDYDSGERVFCAVDCRTAEAPFGVRLFAARVTVP
jgi:hypothetical protein